jgi:hypothetical protein
LRRLKTLVAGESIIPIQLPPPVFIMIGITSVIIVVPEIIFGNCVRVLSTKPRNDKRKGISFRVG